MPSVAVLVPVLARPHRVAPLVESLNLSVAVERAEGWDVWAEMIVSLNDVETLEAVAAAPNCATVYVPWEAGGGDYAKKINYAALFVEADWYLTAADDLEFHPGWLRAAIDRHIKTGCLVIGTNDLHNPSVKSGLYATHLLVHRDYVVRGTIDEPGKLMHEGYDHNCPDTELVETAKTRGEFAFARDSHVEHLHPIWRGAPDDSTYRKGREHHQADKRLFAQRRRLWTRTAKERRMLRHRVVR